MTEPAVLPALVGRWSTRRRWDYEGNPAGGAWRPQLDPATGTAFTSVRDMTPEDISTRVEEVRASYDRSTPLSLKERCSLLRGFAAQVAAHTADLAEIDVLCTGKLLSEAKRGAERAGAVALLYASMLEQGNPFLTELAAPAPNIRQQLDRPPVGLVACILPWNYPVAQGCARIAMLLASGNAALFKGSELAQPPLLALEELARESGLPEWMYSVVTGGSDAGEALVGHPAVDGICFTGGTATGIKVAQAASERLRRLVLELGGKNPNVVFADADFEQALNGAVSAAFRNQGQICSAGSVLFVEEDICAEFSEALVNRVKQLRPGHGLDPAAELGPLISPAARQRVAELVAAASAAGAELLAGGYEPEDVDAPATSDGFFFLPTVLRAVPADAAIATEEVFGPVVEIVPFTDEDEVVRWTNASRFGLTAALWTSDHDRAVRVAGRLRTGVVWINCHGPVANNAPWGGFRMSGLGRILGVDGLYAFTEPRHAYELLEP